MPRKRGMTADNVDWPQGYICLVPYAEPHPNDTYAGRADNDTFAFERRRSITRAVREHVCHTEYNAPWNDDITCWELEHKFGPVRARVWDRLYSFGFRVVPCAFGGKG